METQNVETQKTPKIEAVENLSNASVFQKLGKLGAKNRADLATKMLAYLKNKGKIINNKNKKIDLPHLKQQISAMVRDIKTKLGKSWHTQLTVLETEKVFKLVPK